jgi:hypothetical protein
MIIVISILQCTSSTPLVRVSGFLDITEWISSIRKHAETSNPLLQSFEGIFKSLVEQVGVNLSCVYGCMSECLLNDEDVRGPSIQSGCETVPQAVRRDSLVNSSFYNPLVETTLDLTCGNSLLQLAEKKCLGFAEDLFALFQVPVKNCAQFGVEKAIDYLSTLGLDSDPLLQQDDILEVKVNQLGQPDASMQEETDDYLITVCLPALMMSDCLQEDTFLILSQEDRRFSVLVFDLDTDSWIMIDLASVGQPPEEAFDRSPGAIDGSCHFLFAIGLLLHRIAKEETIDVSGCDLLNIVVKAKMIQQQIQISLLGTNRVWRPAICKLVIQKMFYCLLNFQIVLLFLFVKSYVQQCHVKPRKSRQKKEINVTVRW